MANTSSTAFGFRPLRKVGQTDNNAGLGEWQKLSGSAAIYHNELCNLETTGVVLSATVSTSTNIGVLNGSFYTDPTTSKPTWSNYAPSVAASDHVCLLNDDPQQMFEAMTSLTNYTDPANSVGACVPIVVGTGLTTSPFTSRNALGAIGTNDQIKILGLTRDTNQQDVSVAGSVWRVMINEHILGNNVTGVA
jgi:hypothetical protein